MSWKKKLDRLLFGVEPVTIFDYQKQNSLLKITIVISILCFLLILFGANQLNNEIDSCWSELKNYRVSDNYDSIVGGFPESDCEVIDGGIYCNIDDFRIIE